MEPIFHIPYTFTEEDYRTCMKTYDKQLSPAKGRLMRLLLFLLVPINCLLVLMLLAGDVDTSMISLLMVEAVVLAGYVLVRLLKKKSREKMLQAMQEAGELDCPSVLYAYDDRIELVKETAHSSIPLADIKRVCECADGLYLIHQSNRILYFAARFFNKDTAWQAVCFFQDHLGRKFVTKQAMQVSERASEEVSAIASAAPAAEETSEPLYTFEFDMQQKDVAAVSRGKSIKTLLRVLLGFGVLLALVCVLGHRLPVSDSLPLGLLFGAAAYLSVIGMVSVLGLLVVVFLQASRLNQRAAQHVRHQYFDDYVVTSAETSSHTIPYVKIKTVSRSRRLLVMYLKDNTFLYVPMAAAESEQQFAEFEQFIHSCIVK